MYPWNMKQLNAIKSLAAMAHDGRLGLLRRLIQAGPNGIQAGDLARLAGTNVTTSSAQLLVLSNAGLISSRRSGRHIFYTARYDRIRDLMAFLVEDCCGSHQDICCGLALEAQE